MIPNNPRIQKCEKPPCDFVKINVDAAIIDNMTGLGLIARDSDGLVLCGIADYRKNRMEGGVRRASLVNRIKKDREDTTIFGYRIKEIIGLLDFFTEVKINWINQMSNRVADCLRKLALNKHCTLSFDVEYPYDIHELVMIDSC
ncbi:hypothetical protein Goshw_007101 [Gossypium schwendimanii]|uniref:RNase H type-1 domain-containing protein n=1 Tax=Gossypium schwendimanii TaxID=34291 RepID=A0A7J9LUM0_GOSSC|nr:hypothetical protein [Gossypium schwendimanii]